MHYTDKSYEAALAAVLKHEGGYANNPADNGGETFRGIARNMHPTWPGWRYIDEVKAQGKTSANQINAAFKDDPDMEANVGLFYKTNFYDYWSFLDSREELKQKMFNMSVNVGIGGAIRIMQAALNTNTDHVLSVDGAMGPKTRAALDEVLPSLFECDKLMVELCNQQANYYKRIVERNPIQGQFLNSWIKRAAWVPGVA